MRYTKKNNGTYIVDKATLDEAFTRLGRLEDMLEDIVKKQQELTRELEIFKQNGETKNYHFKEKMGLKLIHNQTLSLLEKYGVIDEKEKLS